MQGVIFDVDGTLVATNDAHIEAWRRAFASYGYEIPRARILPEVGKGGDMLVPALIGDEGNAKDGEGLRKRHGEEYLAIVRRERVAVLPGAIELLETLRDRGTRTALATSSKVAHLEATLRSAGVDFRKLVDEVVTASDAESSKPAPDIVVAAIGELGLPADQCLFVGDTAHDATACAGAGVPFIGLTSGGNTRQSLLEAGALGVWANPQDLLAHFDEAIERTSVARDR